MENTRLPKRAIFGDLVGVAGCVAVQAKDWMVCFPDDVGTFVINADQSG